MAPRRAIRGRGQSPYALLTIDECRRLINAVDPDFRQPVQAVLQTAARYGELARLTVADFNPETRQVSVWQSKSGKSRHVELTDEGASFFTAPCAGRAPDEIMPRRADGGQWLKSNQNRPMAAA